MTILAPQLAFYETRLVHWFTYPDSRGLEAQNHHVGHVAETSKCVMLYKDSRFQHNTPAQGTCVLNCRGRVNGSPASGCSNYWTLTRKPFVDIYSELKYVLDTHIELKRRL